ncbi:hypothetical protein QNO07_04345 [Streptomyces sp. 549]|uniref:DUF6895 family protein n=1 Tax=Streptomyces sp. 549 TaxID=3049076 RepID=UPI0024C24A90|nr:hypothetical protein [Streptomyces sp. 549]MDK1472662.1 hypothetical protein [Streptomyces sp. 549]
MKAEMLDRFALSCLQWAHRNRERFRISRDVTDPETDLNWTMKPLGELAQLSGSVRQLTGSGPVQRLARELQELCWQEVRSGKVLLDLFRAEPQATYPLEIYAAFAGAGMRDQEFERFAATVCGTRAWRLTEQEPNRRLGILNAERRSGFTPHGPFGPALRRTWLGGLPEPWTFERAAGYHLTHAVFHVTDWGAAPHRLPADLGDYLRMWLPCWLDACLEAEQWDLCCELLAVGASLPEPPPGELLDPAWLRLSEVQGADGSLRETGSAPTGKGPELAFAYSYHSTLAAAFAATLSAGRQRQGDRPQAQQQQAQPARGRQRQRGRRDGAPDRAPSEWTGERV